MDGNIIDVSLFNNANNANFLGVNQTTGLYLRLDTDEWTATLVQKLIDPNDTIYSRSQGNLQLLDDGHSIMGYGSTPRIKEYASNGSVIMSVKFGPGEGSVFSYRAYRLPWIGQPSTLPKAVACRDQTSNQTMVYMSWNGATEYTSWNVYAGDSMSDLSFATGAARTGFETAVVLGHNPSYIRADAYGLNMTLGTSEVMKVQEEC